MGEARIGLFLVCSLFFYKLVIQQRYSASCFPESEVLNSFGHNYYIHIEQAADVRTFGTCL